MSSFSSAKKYHIYDTTFKQNLQKIMHIMSLLQYSAKKAKHIKIKICNLIIDIFLSVNNFNVGTKIKYSL